MTPYIVLIAIGGTVILVVVIRTRDRRSLSVPIAPPGIVPGLMSGAARGLVSPRQPTPTLVDVPRPVCVAWLYVQRGLGLQGTTIPLQALRITLGSGSNCDVRLYGDDIPELACTIQFTPDDPYGVLTPEGDAGVLLNGSEGVQHRLGARDVITIHSYSLVYFDSIWRA
jgi:hypothetical protein